MAEKFQKPLSAGVSAETGYFTADGGSGFNLSSYGGRLQFAFWKKGEGMTDNTKMSVNPSQVITMYQNLLAIYEQRKSAYISSGPEMYADFNLPLEIGGVVDGQYKTFAVFTFSTVPVNGIKRIQVSMNKGGTQSTIVLCDKGGCVKGAKSVVDEADGSFARLVNDLGCWIQGVWLFGGINKLFNSISGGNGGGAPSQPSYQRQSSPSSGGDGDNLPWD